MDSGFKETLQSTLELYTHLRIVCNRLTEELWALVPNEDPHTLEAKFPTSRLKNTRAEYHRLEIMKALLDSQVARLRMEVTIPNGTDEFGKPKTIKCQDRHAWINLIEFNSRSAMMGLQGIYARFLFMYQPQLFCDKSPTASMLDGEHDPQTTIAIPYGATSD